MDQRSGGKVTRNLVASTFIKDEESLLTNMMFSYHMQKDKIRYVQTLVEGETKGIHWTFQISEIEKCSSAK